MAKIRLVEKVSVVVPKENIEIFDRPILFEDANGKTQKKMGKLKEVPVTRYTENANGRIYPKPLWEKVEKSKAFEGSSCRADHPSDDGSVKDICGVWSNFKVKEDVSVADLTVIGSLGRNMLEIVEAEGKLGFSTVGLGELSEDNKTVKEDYEYEHTDWVMVPSQGVYGTNENLSENSNITTNFENNITNKKIDIISENKTNEVKNMDRINEANLKNHINRTIREATKNENISDAIEDLNSLVVPETMVEEKAQIKDVISRLHEKLEQSKKEIEQEYAKTSESYEELKEKYEVQSKMLESMKDKFNKIDNVVKSHGLDNIKDIELLKESMSEALHDIDVLKEERENLLSDMKVAMQERVDMLKDIKAFSKKTKLNESEKLTFKESLKEKENQIKKYEKYVNELEEKLIEEGYEIKEDGEKVESSKMTESEIEYIKELEEKLIEEGYEIQEEDDNDKDEDEDEDEDEDNDKEDVEEKKNYKKKKESSLPTKNEKDVLKAELETFFQEQVKSFPGLKDYEEEVVSSESFMEAVKKIDSIKENKSDKDQVRFSEMRLNTSWIPEGRL